jgi:outer membrane protein assembly factor BamB
MPGNTVVRYDTQGNLLGTFGSGYNEAPSSFAFDAQGNVYVGQADATGDILKFDAAGNRVASFDVATAVRGTDHIDLAADGCTMFYTSRTKDVFRFNVCTNTQLPFFNTQLLPGEAAYHIRVLPDGGVLVADSLLIVRLDASGNQIQTYFAPGEPNYWGGLDLVGDGTFWASNAATDNIYKFDLQSGAILARFSAGSGMTAAGVGVRPIRR